MTLDVRDDGAGFAVADERGSGDGSGFGLTGMRQRIARVAGSLAIESEPGAGTAISAPEAWGTVTATLAPPVK